MAGYLLNHRRLISADELKKLAGLDSSTLQPELPLLSSKKTAAYVKPVSHEHTSDQRLYLTKKECLDNKFLRPFITICVERDLSASVVFVGTRKM